MDACAKAFALLRHELPHILLHCALVSRYFFTTYKSIGTCSTNTSYTSFGACSLYWCLLTLYKQRVLTVYSHKLILTINKYNDVDFFNIYEMLLSGALLTSPPVEALQFDANPDGGYVKPYALVECHFPLLD